MTTSTPQRPPGAAPAARRGRTRERLLDAAYEVFAEHGVHAATVEQVCERAGFTRGAFYSNFTSKEELFFALMEREHDLRLTALDERIDAVLPTLDSLDELDEEALGDLILQFLLGPFDNRTWCLVSSEFLLLAMRDPAVAPDYVAYAERFERALVPIVQRAVDHVGREFVMDARAAVRILCAVQVDALQTFILDARGDEPGAQPRLALARTVMALTRPRAT